MKFLILTQRQSSTYTAAVVEAPVINYTQIDERIAMTNKMVDVIHSPAVKDAEIIVLPEALFNIENSSIALPRSAVFCDDVHAHFVFRNLSCAARSVSKYLVINVYSKVKCADDDQPFCANQTDRTNIYNMAFVFDRQGATIAK